MRKLSKIMIFAIGALAFVACGGTKESSNSVSSSTQPSSVTSSVETANYKTPTREVSYWQAYTQDQYVNESVENKTIAYQFSSDDLGLTDMKTALLINLYDDGFVRVTQYHGNPNIFHYLGYWMNQNDENLLFVVSHYTLQDQACTIDYSYTLSKDDNFAFSYNASLGFKDGGQYVRSGEVSGTGEVVYQNEEAFVAAINTLWGVTSEPDDPNPDDPSDKEVLFSWTGSYTTFDCNKDGSYTFQYDGAGLTETGTWEWVSWTFKVHTAQGQEFVATMDDQTHALSFQYIADSSSQLKETFTCGADVWGQALGTTGTYTPVTA